MTKERIPVGQILIMREEFDHVAADEQAGAGARLRARRLIQLLEELLAYREGEVAHVK